MDTFNIGIISMLSPFTLTTLVLDKCFQDGASSTILRYITSLSSLTQLTITQARDNLIQNISGLTTLTSLKYLELDAIDNNAITLSSAELPISLQYLGLANIDLVLNPELNNGI